MEEQLTAPQETQETQETSEPMISRFPGETSINLEDYAAQKQQVAEARAESKEAGASYLIAWGLSLFSNLVSVKKPAVIREKWRDSFMGYVEKDVRKLELEKDLAMIDEGNLTLPQKLGFLALTLLMGVVMANVDYPVQKEETK